MHSKLLGILMAEWYAQVMMLEGARRGKGWEMSHASLQRGGWTPSLPRPSAQCAAPAIICFQLRRWFNRVNRTERTSATEGAERRTSGTKNTTWEGKSSSLSTLITSGCSLSLKARCLGLWKGKKQCCNPKCNHLMPLFIHKISTYYPL